MPYQFEIESLVWTTSRNKDHGYVRDIIVVQVLMVSYVLCL